MTLTACSQCGAPVVQTPRSFRCKHCGARFRYERSLSPTLEQIAQGKAELKALRESGRALLTHQTR